MTCHFVIIFGSQFGTSIITQLENSQIIVTKMYIVHIYYVTSNLYIIYYITSNLYIIFLEIMEAPHMGCQILNMKGANNDANEEINNFFINDALEASVVPLLQMLL